MKSKGIVYFLFFLPSIVCALESVDDLPAVIKMLDKKQGALYKKTIDSSNKTTANLIKSSQHNWKIYRDETCIFEAKLNNINKTWAAKSSRYALSQPCIKRLTLARISQLENYQRALGVQTSTNTSLNTGLTCTFGNLPKNYKIHYIYRSQGLKRTDIKLKNSNYLLKSSDIFIEYSSQPVLLVILSSSPIIWKIHKTKDTNITGVLLGGNRYNTILGLTNNTPIIHATESNKNKCLYINPSKSFDEIERSIIHYTSKKIDHFVSKNIGDNIVIANHPDILENISFIHSSETSINDVDYLEKAYAGETGLLILRAKNIIRMANKNDIESWINSATQNQKNTSHGMRMGKTYVVNERFTLPLELNREIGLSFIVPERSLTPRNVTAHNGMIQFVNVYDLKSGTCSGDGCTGTFKTP